MLKRQDDQSGVDSVIDNTTLKSCDFLMTSASHQEGFFVNGKDAIILTQLKHKH